MPGDMLVLQGDPTVLQPLVDQAKLEMLGADEIAAVKPRDKDDELETAEAVVAPDSPLVGRTPQDLHLRQRYEVNLLALSRGGRHTTTRLRAKPLRSRRHRGAAGRGRRRWNARSPSCDLLPLAERNLSIGTPRWRWVPLLILLAAMIAIAIACG